MRQPGQDFFHPAEQVFGFKGLARYPRAPQRLARSSSNGSEGSTRSSTEFRPFAVLCAGFQRPRSRSFRASGHRRAPERGPGPWPFPGPAAHRGRRSPCRRFAKGRLNDLTDCGAVVSDQDGAHAFTNRFPETDNPEGLGQAITRLEEVSKAGGCPARPDSPAIEVLMRRLLAVPRGVSGFSVLRPPDGRAPSRRLLSLLVLSLRRRRARTSTASLMAGYSSSPVTSPV